jgi:hypothetical protein
MTIRGYNRLNLTLLHFTSAIKSWHRVAEVEQQHAGEDFGAFWEEMAERSIAGVFSVVAGLETYSNELFINRATTFPDLPLKLLDEMWPDFERKPVIAKFVSILHLRDETQKITGKRPCQDIADLVELRNALMHFAPEWSYQKDDHADISTQLAPRFEPSEWYVGQPMFPKGWVTARALEWAISSAVKFVDEFQLKATLPDRLEHIRTRVVGPTDR